MSDSIIASTTLGFQWPTLDPFLFCVHHDDAYPKGNEQLGPAASLAGRNLGNDFEGIDGWRMYHGDVVPGFPQHPHRGFETVTIARQGFIDHSDSLGATARFGQGDVQWLTAGKGIVHCEMFPLVNRDAANPAELFQIWLNLPRASKMVAPHFSMLWKPRIPVVERPGTKVTVIAGEFDEVKPLSPPPSSWASRPESDVAIWSIVLEPNARLTLPPAKPGTNRTVYFFRGATLRVEGTEFPNRTAVQVKAEASISLENGAAQGEVLVLQGRPLKEPVAQYGPFVMNTQQEILEAFADYRKTQFGGWPFDRDDPVHSREQARFARHADGRVEQAP